jgi:hypothetical protein
MVKNISANIGFEEKMKRLSVELNQQFKESKELEEKIMQNLSNINIGGGNG